VTPRMREVFGKVCRAWPSWYRAADSGQRVTLASLWRHGVLERRAWRGVEGEADAAHEYRPSNDVMVKIAEGKPR